jgi:hypothetical protein
MLGEILIPREILTPGDKEIILFPQPGALLSLAFKENKKPDDSQVDKIIEEHLSVLAALCSVVDHENVYLVQTDLIMAKRTASGVDIISSTPPDMKYFPSIRLGGQESLPIEMQKFGERVFLRDLFTIINGFCFVDPDASPDVKEDDRIIRSSLGEGGKVLQAGRVIVVSEDLWQDPSSRKHLEELRRKGYLVAYIPPVEANLQFGTGGEFIRSHIDGHTSLVTGKDGKMYFLYAKSYARQGGKTAKALRNAANYIDAIPTEVDDEGLPPLAFNFVQLRDGSVIMTGSDGSQKLKERVAEIVGPDRLITTSVPIVEIPRLSKGGIRCMVNSAPMSVLQGFSPTIVSS